MENGYNIGTIVLALAYLGKHAIVNCDHPLARRDRIAHLCNSSLRGLDLSRRIYVHIPII